MGRLGGSALSRGVHSVGLTKNEKDARAGSLGPPDHGRCSFVMRRGLPAKNTLGPRRGATQDLSADRISRTADVR